MVSVDRGSLYIRLLSSRLHGFRHMYGSVRMWLVAWKEGNLKCTYIYVPAMWLRTGERSVLGSRWC